MGFSFTLSIVSVLAFVVIGGILSALILYTRVKLIGFAPCKLIINDNEKEAKAVKAGTTLLSALLAEGISVPSPCGGKATCKQCKVRVVEGGGPILETDRSTFSKQELEQGWRLSCQCKVKNDVKLLLPESLLNVQEMKAKVVSNDNVATFIKELVIEPEGRVEYRPGAYMQFYVPPFSTNTSQWKKTMDPKFYSDWERFGMFDRKISFSEEVVRAYSMASYPEEKGVLKFNVRIATPPIQKGKLKNTPWGICSSYLFSLKPGDEVKISGPYGESYMIDDERELVFLIGGAGSSFGRAHVMDLFKSKKTKRKVAYWYGARSLKENIYQKDLEELANTYENFSYHLVLSEPLEEDKKKGWPIEDPVKTNYLYKAFETGQLQKMKEPENCLYYVCGPPMHNLSAMKLLDSYGVLRKDIVLDDFGN